MKQTLLSFVFAVVAVIASNANARSATPADLAGLSCQSTLTLSSGASKSGPAFIGDHLMMGPIVVANLVEGGQDTTQPMLEAAVIGMISIVDGQDLMAIAIEASSSRIEFQPFKESRLIARGSMVLSRTISALSKNGFSVTGSDGSSIQLECELK